MKGKLWMGNSGRETRKRSSLLVFFFFFFFRFSLALPKLGFLLTLFLPAYYIPPQCVRMPLSTTPRSTFCEWKGAATYYSIMSPINAAETIQNRIWSYNDPTHGYEVIKGYLAFYAGPWECYVNGERVQPQPGDFYGGWVTGEILGVVKGQWGNWDPVL